MDSAVMRVCMWPLEPCESALFTLSTFLTI
jgi:hypothetical protein